MPVCRASGPFFDDGTTGEASQPQHICLALQIRNFRPLLGQLNHPPPSAEARTPSVDFHRIGPVCSLPPFCSSTQVYREKVEESILVCPAVRPLPTTASRSVGLGIPTANPRPFANPSREYGGEKQGFLHSRSSFVIIRRDRRGPHPLGEG